MELGRRRMHLPSFDDSALVPKQKPLLEVSSPLRRKLLRDKEDTSPYSEEFFYYFERYLEQAIKNIIHHKESKHT
jgi:hypothetical protein